MGKYRHFLIIFCLFSLGLASCAKKKSDREDSGGSVSAVKGSPSTAPTSSALLPTSSDADPAAPNFSDPSSTIETQTDTSLSISVTITDAITANITDTNETVTSESCEKLGSFWAFNPKTQKCQSKLLQTGHTYYVISTMTGGCISAKTTDTDTTTDEKIVPPKLVPCKVDDMLKWKFILETDNSFSLHPQVTPSECLGALNNEQVVPAPLSTNPACGWASLFRIQASTSTADPNQVPVPISLVTDSGLHIPHPSNELYNDTNALFLTPTDAGEAFPWLLLDTQIDPLKAFLLLKAANQVPQQTRVKWTNRVLPRQFSDWMDLLPIDCGFSSIEQITLSPIMYGLQVGALQANYTCASTSLHLPQCTEIPSDCLDFPTGQQDYSLSSLLTKNSATNANNETEFNYSCTAPQRLTAFWYQDCKNAAGASDRTGRKQKVTRCCSSIGDDSGTAATPITNRIVWTADATNTSTDSTETINTTGSDQTCRPLGCRYLCPGAPIPSYRWSTSRTCTNMSNELLLGDITATPTIACTPGTHLQSLFLSLNSDSQRKYTLTYTCTRVPQP